MPGNGTELYDVLDTRAARFLVECLIDEDNGTALICDPDEIFDIVAHRDRTARPAPMFS